MPDPQGNALVSWASVVAFHRYFWQPPRAHGDVIEGRDVSFLELFYDLVYVVVISQAAGHLARDVTWAGMGRFAVVASALLPDGARLAAWALLVVGWLAGITVLDWRNGAIGATRLSASESMIERFDLFTIIVLGEVVVGVVNGIVDAARTPIAVVTGMLGLGIGFAYWWSYFDLVGARRVAADRGALSRWLVGHLPVTMTIAATGGVMLSMVEHASEGSRSPAPAAMVLSLSVAVGVLALVLVAASLADWRDLAPVYRPVSVAFGVAAVVALLLGWLAPPPWLQILLLTLVLGGVWFYGILTWFSFTHQEG